MNRREFLSTVGLVVATASLADIQFAGSASATPIRSGSGTGSMARRRTAELLDQVQTVHGGRRWREASVIKADIAYGGPFWAVKGVPDFVSTDQVVADIHRQHIRLVQPSGRVIEFDKHEDIVTVTEPHGSVERLRHPRATFDGYTSDTLWSVAQAGYFRAYATWLFLLEAYVFTYPGVRITEIEPWVENGETWRVLSVTFPKSIDTHSATQRYYFDAHGYMTRQDYEPVINGSSPIAHYQPERADIHGAVVTTKHQIFARNADNTPDRSLVRISLDVANISLH